MKLRLSFSLGFLFILLLTACGGHKEARVSVPTPPSISDPESHAQSTHEPPEQPAGPSQSGFPINISPNTKPILVETGKASWYGAPYHSRRGSNGEIYDMNAMTAAHRTLPLGSIVRVTNAKTGHSAIVKITDRGPFIPGRILDLSLAAAKKIDVWKPGIAVVRLEVLQTPVPLNTGGHWAVQIGAFDEQDSADKFANSLSRRYHSAKVKCFSSPVGNWWVRVRVQGDDRQRAEELARNTQTSQASTFLVRLD